MLSAELRLVYRFFIGLGASSNCAIMPTATSNEISDYLPSASVDTESMMILDFCIMYLHKAKTTHSADDRGIDIEDD